MPSPVPVEMVARVVTACRSVLAARVAMAGPAESVGLGVTVVPEARVGFMPVTAVTAVTVVMG